MRQAVQLPPPEQPYTAARSATLTQEAEALLLQSFAFKDMLSPDVARFLAQQVSLRLE